MTSDDSMWAPPGDDDQPPARSPLGPDPSLPDAPSRWAPPSPAPQAFTPPPTEHAPSPAAEQPAAAQESVVVGPVEASTVSGSAIGRLIAAVLAVAMIGGGAFLAFGAGSADGGADSPEAAFEQALAAIEAGDLIALAEVMEPAERDTVFDAGLAFLDEMVRLEVLADDFDASAVDGYDFSLAGADLRVERAREDLARIYVGAGVLDASVDVAGLPLGRRILEQLTPEQQTFTDRSIEVIEPQESPFVAVQRDGRWYLSYAYTVAENARLELGAPMPDPFERPAAIGAATPEEAAAQFLEEAVRFDVARMIGMLDPEEAAALYDYSPLFLDDASATANELLQSAEQAGWSWGFDELVFRADTDGDLATVYLERMTFSAAGENGSGSFSIADGAFSADLTLIDDFWGEETSWSVRAGADGCFDITVESGDMRDQMNSCDEGSGLEAAPAWELQEFGVVARQVDGRWYLSPVRTTLDAMISAVEQIDNKDLDAVLGSAFFLPGMVLGDLPTADPVFVGSTDDDITLLPTIENGDLLADGLDIEFSYDLDPEQAEWELGFFAPGLDAIGVTRGAYATVDGGIGEVAVVVVEVADNAQASDVLAAFAAERDGVEPIGDPNRFRIAFNDDYGDPVFVAYDGDIVTLVGVYGTDADTALTVFEQQLAG